MPHDRKGLNYSVLRRGSVFSSQGTFLLRACIGHTHETRSNSTALLHNLPRKK